MTNAPTRILGLDPGLRRTGWGVVAAEGSRLRWIAHGRHHAPAGAAQAGVETENPSRFVRHSFQSCPKEG